MAHPPRVARGVLEGPLADPQEDHPEDPLADPQEDHREARWEHQDPRKDRLGGRPGDHLEDPEEVVPQDRSVVVGVVLQH